jgi:dimethylaniline monooxygenase (N-oxide forming)
VIFATGYSFGFPYLENGKLIDVNENKVTLYKLMFPPELSPRNTLAVIGLIQPMGSISKFRYFLLKLKSILVPIAEMQARLFCSVLTGQTILPKMKKMQENALKLNARNKKYFKESRRHTLQVSFLEAI